MTLLQAIKVVRNNLEFSEADGTNYIQDDFVLDLLKVIYSDFEAEILEEKKKSYIEGSNDCFEALNSNKKSL